MITTSLSPAVPQDQYKTYVVDTLNLDDFGSFEVTFTATNTETVSIQLTYKDTEGNVYNSLQDVKVSASDATSQKNTGLTMILTSSSASNLREI